MRSSAGWEDTSRYSPASVRELVTQYFHAYRGHWLVGFIFTVASTSLGLVTPWLLVTWGFGYKGLSTTPRAKQAAT